MRVLSALLVPLALSACSPSPELLVEVRGGVFFDGLQIGVDGARLYYTVDDELAAVATMTAAGEQELGRLLGQATRGREFAPCPADCGVLGCPGVWTLHNADDEGDFTVQWCGTGDAEQMEFIAHLSVLIDPVDCASNEFVEVEGPCPGLSSLLK